MKFTVGLGTDVGRKRQQNQDNAATFPDLGFFVVADGMGGHRGGETASAIVIEVAPQIVRDAQKSSGWSAKRVITDAIQKSNSAIFDRSQKEPRLQGMGTTTTAMLFNGKTLTVGHVGDSRCYYFSNGSIWQVTRDHSLVQEKLKAGIITRERMKTDQMKNVITRSVGFEPEVNVELYEMEIKKDDVFLLCSDGLSGQAEDEEILQLVSTHLLQGNDIKRATDELIAKANANGGDDNITSVLVRVDEV